MITAMRARLPFLALGLVAGLVFNAFVALAWTGPQNSPPSCVSGQPGCDPLINVGSALQVKNGDIGVNNFAGYGNALLSGLGFGVGRYLNFDYTTLGTSGTLASGYGIRDNLGTLEFKNLGGSWASLQSTISALVPAGQWTTSGSNIYNSNSGNVGVGTASPGYKLDVSGSANATQLCIAGDCRSAWPSGAGTVTGGPGSPNVTLDLGNARGKLMIFNSGIPIATPGPPVGDGRTYILEYSSNGGTNWSTLASVVDDANDANGDGCGTGFGYFVCPLSVSFPYAFIDSSGLLHANLSSVTYGVSGGTDQMFRLRTTSGTLGANSGIHIQPL